MRGISGPMGLSDENLLWYACSEPERPNDPYIVWHHDCHACHVKALASERRWPDDPLVRHVVTSTRPRSADQ